MLKPTSFVRGVSCALITMFCFVSPLGSLAYEVHAATTPTVVIGEVAWAGSSLSTADEWLELWNMTDAPISLGGWSLQGAGESNKTIYFPSNSTIEAHATFLISNYAANDLKSILITPTAVVTTTVSLPNSNFKIDLIDPQGIIIDRAGSESTPPAGTTSPIKASMMRIDATLDGSAAASWTTATSTEGLKAEVSDLGTPGRCDHCNPLTTSDATSTVLVSSAENDQATSLDTEPIQIGIDTTSTINIATSTFEINIETTTTTLTEITSEATTAATEQPVTTNDSASDATTTIMEDTPLVADSDNAINMETTTADPLPETESTEEPIPSEALLETIVVPETQISASNVDSISTTTSSTFSVQTPTAVINDQLLRLNEVSPNPTSGKEWVEIISLDSSQTISLKAYQLYDATGRIFTFDDVAFTPNGSHYIVAEIPTSRLNNDGDTVSLHDPSGQLIHALSYSKTEKGKSWIHWPDLTGNWQLTQTPTPGVPNILTVPHTTATTTSITTTATSSAPATSNVINTPSVTPVLPMIVPLIEMSPSTTSTFQTPPKQTTPQNTKKTATATKTKTVATAKTPMKPVSKTAPKPIHLITFDMLNQEFGNLRIRLQGSVGTPPGLLTSHAFVLQAPDGRGLLVKVPSTQKLPDYGIQVGVIGTLRFDTTNTPYIQLNSTDHWQKLTTMAVPPIPRLVDLLAPSTEDAWSFVQVTGTIQGINGSTIHLDLNDAEVDVMIRPLTHYRVKRLAVGDVVTVSGIVDTGAATPRVFPRTDAEITLMQHAILKPEQSVGSSTSNLPGWTPFGAAAGAVGVTEGAKHLRRRRQRRDLEKKLQNLVHVG